jgi:ABC-type microcin C transport system permease subunit YejE
MLETILHFLIFLLAFSLSYALLLKAKIFSGAINLAISLVIGFYSLFVFLSFKEISKIFAYLSIFFLLVFLLSLLAKGFKREELKK